MMINIFQMFRFFKIKHRKDNPQIGKYYPRSTLQAFQIIWWLVGCGSWNKEGLGIGYHPEDTYGKTLKILHLLFHHQKLHWKLESMVMKHQSDVIQPIKIFVFLQAPMQAVVRRCITRRMRAQHGQNHKQTHQSCCDPTIDWSSDGGIVYQADLSSSIGVRWSRSLDQGVTWESMKVLTPSGSDKEWVHVDRSQTSPYKDNVLFNVS